MNKQPEDLRIIYMGTPEFAVPTLDSLVDAGMNVVAVITAPDKPAGRNMKLKPSAVKQCALKHNLPVLQPPRLKNPAFLEELRSYKADLQIVVAFRMLPEVVWNMPELGTFNLHGSLLPQYRGAAPINWAVANGDKETGLTTFFLKHEIDTGDILLQEKEPIHAEDTAGTLYERLMAKGPALVLKTVALIASGNYQLQQQDTSKPIKHAPKLSREIAQVDLNQRAEAIHNFVRGMSPFPTAWIEFEGKPMKLHKTNPVQESYGGGEKPFHTDGKTFFHLPATDGYVEVLELQLPNKKRMPVEDFLRGARLGE